LLADVRINGCELERRTRQFLRTPGPFDDFDVSVTIRFIKGSYEHISAGLELRSGIDFGLLAHSPIPQD